MLSEPAPLGAIERPRQHPQQLFCVAREGIFARRAKTNLPMCLRRCESSSLGRFAERVGSWLHLAAAEVPCKTAPFASFSGRAEKEGPARPERGPIRTSKASVTRKFYEIVLSGEVSLITFVVLQVSLTRLRSLCSMQRERSKRNTRRGVFSYAVNSWSVSATRCAPICYSSSKSHFIPRERLIFQLLRRRRQLAQFHFV